MSNYDDLLREKENKDPFNDSFMEKHWAALEKKIDTTTQQPQSKYRKLFRTAIAVAAVFFIAFLGYTLLNENKQQPHKIAGMAAIRSAIVPPLNGTNVPYETFSFNATTGDTLFTMNGSVIIFPGNAVINNKGEIVNGNIEIRTREFNDAFDYSIAGLPMDYDSAGTKYQFISSGMIDISAYQNGEVLKVNPEAKPQLHLVSTNKERNTNLYILDTVTGDWINKGKDEVNLVGLKSTTTDRLKSRPDAVHDFIENTSPVMPVPPQKASELNPVINVVIDPASFKELLVYDGLKFEVIDIKAGKVGEDSKIEWDNIELKRGNTVGTYIVVFSIGSRKAIYNVKPVLEGKDFEAAEKLYQEKLQDYTRIQTERKTSDKKTVKENERMQEDNKRIEELNKLVVLRNRFIEAENKKIDALNNAISRRRDSAKKAINERQSVWEQNNRLAALEQNLIRSFQIDGFGYWNCDQPTLPETLQYVSTFKTAQNEVVNYNTLCMAIEGINRIQNYYRTNNIGLIPNSRYFGWAFNANRFYYFTKEDFKNASVTNNPNTISISMSVYRGDLKNYNELKGYLFNRE